MDKTSPRQLLPVQNKFGIAERLEEGREGRREEGGKKGKLEITRKMLQLATPFDVIEQSTGLLEKQISEMKKSE